MITSFSFQLIKLRRVGTHFPSKNMKIPLGLNDRERERERESSILKTPYKLKMFIRRHLKLSTESNITQHENLVGLFSCNVR